MRPSPCRKNGAGVRPCGSSVRCRQGGPSEGPDRTRPPPGTRPAAELRACAGARLVV